MKSDARTRAANTPRQPCSYRTWDPVSSFDMRLRRPATLQSPDIHVGTPRDGSTHLMRTT